MPVVRHSDILTRGLRGAAILGSVPLPIDTSRPARTRAEQVALVEAVRDAPADEQETNYLEWKGTLDLASKAARATLAKAVLGFSNRRPDVAGRNCGGCAYLLVGVEPGSLAGVEPVDAAKLESGLAPYVGPSVQWRPDYVEVGDRKVLVVTVEPPQWGDPVHPVRKSFLGDADKPLLPEGTVFVRHQASTDPAKAPDIDDLSRRAARRTDNDLAINVRRLDDSPLRRVDRREESIAAIVRHRRDFLMRPLSSPVKSTYSVLAFKSAIGEYRSAETYTKEVDEYIAGLAAALPEVLLARSVLHDAGLLRLGVVNNTERTFTGVRVELALPEGVEVCVWKQDVNDRVESPQPPMLYGKGGVGAHPTHLYGDILRGIAQSRPLWVPDADSDGETTSIVYCDTEVRADGTHELPPIWLLLDQGAPGELRIKWEATAKEANKRLSGTIVILVAAEFMGGPELLANPPGSD